MDKTVRKRLREIYSFMEKVYPANWQTRWNKTQYMASFAEQEKIDKFVNKVGKFESVPGHVWACIGLWMSLRQLCPNLDKLVNSEEIYERLWAHDLGETYRGDISYAVKIHSRLDEGKDEERKDLIKLARNLPFRERKRLIRWFDEFEEKEDEKSVKLEVLVARWIDNLQGDHFVLVFGNDLDRYTKTLEKITKKRSAGRSKRLIDYLRQKAQTKKDKSQSYIKAAQEVRAVILAHITSIRKRSIKFDLSELGF